MKWFRKAAVTLAVLCFGAAQYVSPVYADEAGNAEFDKFLEEMFVEEMESDFMTMHFTIADYRSAGIEKPERIIGHANMEDYADEVEYSEELLKKLESFDYDSLSVTQQHDYDTLKFDLENNIALNKYPLFDFCFTPTEGLINNLLTNFTEYVFREKEDIDDYLEVLASVPAFINGALDITKTQAAAGNFMTDGALDDTLDQIDSFCEKTEDNQLIIIFEENIDAFEGLTDTEREDYKKRNREIVLNQYIPCYEEAGRVLDSLRGSRKVSGGLCEMDGGREYYAAKARMKSSSEYSVQEMLDMCTEFLNETMEEYIAIYMSNPSVFDSDETVDMSTPEEILTYLQNHLQNYPEGPEVTYSAKYLDPSVANDGIVAYYLEPPLDDIKDNVIKINGDAVGDVNELYVTLSHEGFPGHLYQITWYLNTNPARIRSTANMIGYTEGWAMYSEMRAMEFSGLSDDAARMTALDTALNYVLDCAVDLGVNGLGWDKEDVAKYLDDLNLNSSIAQALIDFVLSDPGVLLPYGFGLVQFEDMYKQAREALGDKFDIREFHEILLTYGSRPFEEVRKDVNAWIESKGGSAPSPSPKPAPSKDGSKGLLIGIGIGIIAVIIIAILARRSYKKSA